MLGIHLWQQALVVSKCSRQIFIDVRESTMRVKMELLCLLKYFFCYFCPLEQYFLLKHLVKMRCTVQTSASDEL